MSTKVCLNCLEQVMGDLKCGRCRIARYCNKECQVNHWKVHKNICEESNHEDATKKLGMKAANASLQGDNHKAKKLYTKLVDICTRTLGENHPYTLSAMSDLANNYSNLGQHAEAEKLQKQCHCKILLKLKQLSCLLRRAQLLPDLMASNCMQRTDIYFTSSSRLIQISEPMNTVAVLRTAVSL